MEHQVVTSKQVRQRLGSMLTDIKYLKEEVKLVSKPGEDDYACVIANAQFLRDQGVDIPHKSDEIAEKESKPDSAKSKAKKK
jgi:hypothetical protein